MNCYLRICYIDFHVFMIITQESEGDGMESQNEGDLPDLGDLSVHGPGSVDVKKEIGKSKLFTKVLLF